MSIKKKVKKSTVSTKKTVSPKQDDKLIKKSADVATSSVKNAVKKVKIETKVKNKAIESTSKTTDKPAVRKIIPVVEKVSMKSEIKKPAVFGLKKPDDTPPWENSPNKAASPKPISKAVLEARKQESKKLTPANNIANLMTQSLAAPNRSAAAPSSDRSPVKMPTQVRPAASSEKISLSSVAAGLQPNARSAPANFPIFKTK